MFYPGTSVILTHVAAAADKMCVALRNTAEVPRKGDHLRGTLMKNTSPTLEVCYIWGENGRKGPGNV